MSHDSNREILIMGCIVRLSKTVKEAFYSTEFSLVIVGIIPGNWG